MLRLPRPGPTSVAALLCLPASLVLLTGCAGDSDTGAQPRSGDAARPLTSIDWSTFSYPSSCFTDGGRDEPVRVDNYEAIDPTGALSMSVTHPVFGDLDGDGVADAAMTYRCIGANASPDTLLVYRATAAGPRLVATLLRGDEVYVDRIRISGGQLTVDGLGYRPGTPHCCPDEDVQIVYHWSAGHLLLDRQTRTPRPQS